MDMSIDKQASDVSSDTEEREIKEIKFIPYPGKSRYY